MNKPGLVRQSGLTLLEVLIAASIMATIAVLAFGALSVTERSREVSEDRLRSIQQLDRVWLMLESDLRNALGYKALTNRGDIIPAMKITYSEDYWLNLQRGGKANPLGFFRTELVRVAYRIENEVLWRDTWYDTGNIDPEQARKQKLLEGIERVEVKVLPDTAKSVDDGIWIEQWPPENKVETLPLALRITFEIEGRGELDRLFILQPGK